MKNAMKNARIEFEKFVGTAEVKCAGITYSNLCDWYGVVKGPLLLKVGYTTDEYQSFLASLNFNYDEGSGCEELYGTIWFNDGTWATRGEYGDSEWWEHHECPEIPSELR